MKRVLFSIFLVVGMLVFVPQRVLADQTWVIHLEDGGTITIVEDDNKNPLYFRHVDKNGKLVYEWRPTVH